MKSKKQKGTSRNRKLSKKSYGNISESQQLQNLHKRAANHIKRLAKDDMTPLDEFVKTTRTLSRMFTLAELTNQAKHEIKNIIKKS